MPSPTGQSPGMTLISSYGATICPLTYHCGEENGTCGTVKTQVMCSALVPKRPQSEALVLGVEEQVLQGKSGNYF